MCMYVLQDSNNYYIGTKQFVPVVSLKKAKTWETYGLARNALNNQVKRAFRDRFSVKALEDDDFDKALLPDVQEEKSEAGVNTETESLKPVPPLNDLCNRTIVKGEADVWEAKINEMVTLFENMDKRYQELFKQLSLIDKEKTDLEHYIEFNKLNASEGWKAFKSLQNVLRQRREIKNEIEAIDRIRQQGLSTIRFQKASQSVAQIHDKKYTPRVCTQLFQEGANAS